MHRLREGERPIDAHHEGVGGPDENTEIGSEIHYGHFCGNSHPQGVRSNVCAAINVTEHEPGLIKFDTEVMFVVDAELGRRCSNHLCCRPQLDLVRVVAAVAYMGHSKGTVFTPGRR